MDRSNTSSLICSLERRDTLDVGAGLTASMVRKLISNGKRIAACSLRGHSAWTQSLDGNVKSMRASSLTTQLFQRVERGDVLMFAVLRCSR